MYKYAETGEVNEKLMIEVSAIPRNINKELPVPFYYQIVQVLRDVIQDLEVDDGDGEVALPSENELCDFFMVNRGTVRHALRLLEREGLIYREKGRGTFLRRRRVELDLTRLCSTTEDLLARGWEPRTLVLSVSEVDAGPHVGRYLELPADGKVLEIYRLRLANEEPISLQRAYIPLHLVPGLAEKDLESSLYYTLKNDYGIELQVADQTVRTRAATPEESQLLEVPEDTPIFEMSRVTFDQHQRPVEYLDALWRGDRYDFHVRLHKADRV